MQGSRQASIWQVLRFPESGRSEIVHGGIAEKRKMPRGHKEGRPHRRRDLFGELLIPRAAIAFMKSIQPRATGFPWFIFPIVGWGVGLLVHGLGAYVFGQKSDSAASDIEPT